MTKHINKTSKLTLNILLISLLIIPLVNKVYSAGTSITSITQAGNSLTINWTEVPGASEYQIFRTSKDKIEKIGVINNATTTTYTDNTINEQTLYQYEVVSVEGGSSNYSQAYSIYTKDLTAPTLPTNLTISTVPGPNFVDLSWNSASSTDVKFYEIYRNSVKVGVSSTNSYRDLNGLVSSTAYTYNIKAVDTSGNVSGFYTNASTTTLAALPSTQNTVKLTENFPGQWTAGGSNPTILTLGSTARFYVAGDRITRSAEAVLNTTNAFTISPSEAGGNSAVVSFSYSKNWYNADNRSGEGENVDFWIDYKSTSSSTWSTVHTNDTGNRTSGYVNASANLTNTAGTYHLRIRASLSTSSRGSDWSELNVDNLQVTLNSTNAAPPVPGVPTLSLGANNDTVQMSWTASSDVNLAGYRIYRNNVLIGTTVSNSFLDASVPQSVNDVTYQYKVEAIDDRGLVSTQTSNVSILVPKKNGEVAVPQPPIDGSISKVTPLTLDLIWDASPTIDVSKYVIYMSTDGTSYSPVGVTTFTNYRVESGLSPLTTYYFRVVAENDLGNFSGPTQVISGTTSSPDLIAPTTPTNFVLSNITSSSIDFSWGLSTDDIEVDRYEIQEDVDGVWTTVRTVSHPIDKVTLEDLTQDTPYSFRILSFDTSGNASSASVVVPTRTALDTSPPEVTFSKPANGSTGVGTGSFILARFSDTMNQSSINNNSLFVVKKGTTTKVPGAFTYTASTEVRFTPSDELLPNTEYEITLTTEIKNGAGISLIENIVWSFTTGETVHSRPHGDFADETEMCKNCHSTHTGKKPKLLNQTEIFNLCFQCHDGTGSTYNVKDQLGAYPTEKNSHHPIYTATQEEKDESGKNFKLTCISCHEPHNRGRNLDTGQPLSSEVKLLWSFNKGVKDSATGEYTVKPQADGSGNNFCWNCHGKEGSPTYSFGYLDGGPLINNYDYRGDHETYYPKNDKGHNSSKMDHYKSSHYIDSATGNHKDSSPTGIKCSICHDNHGSELKPLLRTQIKYDNVEPKPAAVTSNGKEYCYQCHENAVDYTYSDWSSNGTAFNDYDGKVSNETGGHAQFDCQVCHNPHGSAYPNYLRMNYAVGQSTSNRSADAALCLDCHDLNKITSSGPSESDRGNTHAYHFYEKAENAHCKRCHRMHGAKASENTGSLRHKVGFPVTNPGTYNRGETSATCSPSCHGSESISNLRPLTNPTQAQLERSLKTNWKTESKLLTARNSLGLLRYRDANADGLHYK
ncbi:MAG: hypothetical protein K0S51_1267 [Bacillales bacterium]|jgi:predicted CXXCH cytochrome family protein|nr:hypothetical protein [Bacillales bacterium]